MQFKCQKTPRLNCQSHKKANHLTRWPSVCRIHHGVFYMVFYMVSIHMVFYMVSIHMVFYMVSIHMVNGQDCQIRPKKACPVKHQNKWRTLSDRHADHTIIAFYVIFPIRVFIWLYMVVCLYGCIWLIIWLFI